MPDEKSDKSAPQFMRMIRAHWLSQAIHVAATLEVADLLDGTTRSADDLAASTKTHAPSMYRLLRALASEGVFKELPGHQFENNGASEMLRRDAAVSVYGWAIFTGRPYYWQGWGNLLYSVQTGESGVQKALGMDSWRYREANPEEGVIFDRAMTDMTRMLSPAIVAAYDWGKFARIADIGGGNGAQLAAILDRYPHTVGILFDQPHVVTGSADLLRDADVADRCEVVGGSFFDSAPIADAYLLKHILHDWDDADCLRILRTLRRAAPPDARLLVVERIVGPSNEDSDSKLSDLNMLVGPGGQERTAEEFAELFTSGGWQFIEAHGAGARFIIEGALAARD